MARVPLIDSPCPLSQAEQLRINGHCGRCHKTVHALDGLDDDQRRALLAAAKGPLCVSWRTTVRRGPALGAAMAAMLSAGAAMAGQDCDEAKPAFQSVESSPAAPFTVSGEEPGERLDRIVITGGGVRLRDAVWLDEADVQAGEAAGNSELDDRLDTIVMGGIKSSQDASWVDDSSLPDLPVVVETESGQPIDSAVALSAVLKPR
jgi:hypothetical protein